VLAREGPVRFRFASLQSPAGKRLLATYGLPTDVQTVVMVDNERAYVRSSAVLRIVSQLRPPWNALSVFRRLPTPFRDRVYGLVARHRYQWFGRRDRCFVPTPEVKERFL
jgi:predicted DCC family thiol-disulfide oxidoreductase YuxK